MQHIFRLVIGVTLGVILAICSIQLSENLMTHFYPLKIANPTVQDYNNEMKTMPTLAFVIFIVGFGISSFMGSYLASRIANDKHKLVAGLSIGFILLLFALFFFITISHPIWVSISTCCLLIVFSYVGSKAAIR